MKRFIQMLAALFALSIFAVPHMAHAQAQVTTTCGTKTYTYGESRPLTQDTTGLLCTSATGGGGATAVTQSGTWTVQPGNTANTTAWKVDGSAVTQPVSGTVTVTDGAGALNTIVDSGTLTAVTTITNPVTVTDGAGALNVIVDSGSINSTLQTQTDTVMVGGVNVKEINAVTPLMGNGVTGTGSQRVTIASDNTAFTVNVGTVAATNISTNIAQMNGVATTMGNGVSGTGVQRVTIASDSTGNIGVAQGSTTSGQLGPLVQAAVATTIPSYTNAQTSPVTQTAGGALRVTFTDGAAAGSGGTFENNSASPSATVLGPAVMAYPRAAVGGGLTACRILTGTTGFCKAAAGQVYQVSVYNVNAGVRYLQLYNKTSAPTLSTDTPIVTIPLLGAGVRDVVLGADLGAKFTTGIAWAYTTDDIAIPTTAGTSTELHATILYN